MSTRTPQLGAVALALAALLLLPLEGAASRGALRALTLPVRLGAVALAQAEGEGDAQEEQEATPSDEPDAEADASPDEESSDEAEAAGSAADASDERAPSDAEEEAAPPREIVLRDYLVLPKVGEYERKPLAIDPIDALLASGEWAAPAAGDRVTAAEGDVVTWKEVTADRSGALSDVAPGGYALATVEAREARVMVLEAVGHAGVCVGGAWLYGDPSGTGDVRLPVELEEGENELLFHVARPGFRAKLVAPESPVLLLEGDATLPDIVEGDSGELWGAVPVVNATNKTLRGAKMSVGLPGGGVTRFPLASIPPLSVQNAPFLIHVPSTTTASTLSFRVAVVGDDDTSSDGDAELAAVELPVRRVSAQETHTRTFLSGVDRSVQAYSVTPTLRDARSASERPGVLLTLHDWDATRGEHARQYDAKRWAHVVAPASRGALGFDWEDWDAAHAMEALEDAQGRYENDPRRVCVTGYGTGGHGALYLGVTRPDQFAALAPSAAWLSHWTYGGGMPVYEEPTPTQQMLARAATPSDTLKLVRNLGALGMYVLHGVDDPHVPVTQSRYLRRRLGEFHTDFAYLERDGEEAWRGQLAADWPRMMSYLRHHPGRAAEDVREIDFTTVNPGLAADCHWARVELQQELLEPSRVVLQCDPDAALFKGRTENVSRLSLDVSFLPDGEAVTVRLDGEGSVTARTRGRGGRVWLSRDEDSGRWRQVPRPSRRLKGPHRYGAFKSAFDNDALLVYGTRGTAEENAWALAKARYDAQAFWRRANGALDVVADTDFDPARETDRNVVLYGNADTNGAWPALLSTSPVQVRRGRVHVGEGAVRPESGDDLAVLFVRPRPGTDTATVGVVCGTGPHGMRLTNRMRYFFSGVALPDLFIAGPGTVVEGDEDIRAIGNFGPDWRYESGDVVWRDWAL